jgi:transposase InsO family protein
MTMRYQTTRANDAGLRQRMRAIAQERRRFGYRRLHVLLKREGYLINHKKLLRLYREEKPAVRRRGGRKRAIGTRAPMLVADDVERPVLARLCVGSADLRPPLPASSPSSMIVPASAWDWWPAPRSPASAWRGNWTD